MPVPTDTAWALAIVFPLLAIAAVWARIWARRAKKMKLWWDDWLMAPSLLFAIGGAVIVVLASAYGNAGKHSPLDASGKPVASAPLPMYQKIRYANTAILPAELVFPKLSIIMLFQRIFVSPRFLYVTYFLLFINIAWFIAFTLAYLFPCQPVAAAWSTSFGIQDRKCYDQVAFNWAFAASTIGLDLMILAAPMPMVWRLQMPLRQKIAVSGIFLLGGVVTAASCGKLYSFIYVGTSLQKNHDIAYESGPLFYWSIPESCLAIVSACLPTLRPLFRGWSPDSLIGSIRSRISIHSLRGSNGSKGSKNGTTYNKTHTMGTESNESSVGITRASRDNESHRTGSRSGPAHVDIPLNRLGPDGRSLGSREIERA